MHTYRLPVSKRFRMFHTVLDYQVVMDVVRCNGRLGEAAWLVACWSVFKGPDKKLLKSKRSSIREPVSGLDYAALVATQSRILATLSQEIAGAIQGAEKTEADQPARNGSQQYRRDYTSTSGSKFLSTVWGAPDDIEV